MTLAIKNPRRLSHVMGLGHAYECLCLMLIGNSEHEEYVVGILSITPEMN